MKATRFQKLFLGLPFLGLLSSVCSFGQTVYTRQTPTNSLSSPVWSDVNWSSVNGTAYPNSTASSAMISNLNFKLDKNITLYSLTMSSPISQAYLGASITSATLTTSGNVSLTGSGTTIAIPKLIINGNLDLGSGTTLDKPTITNGVVTISSGATANLLNGSAIGNITLNSSGTVTQSGSFSSGGTFNNKGASALLTLNGSGTSSASFAGGTINNTNNATIVKTGSQQTALGSTLVNSANVLISAGSTLNVSNVSNNSGGTITVSNGATLLNSGTVTSNSGSTINVLSGGIFANNNNFVSNGGSNLKVDGTYNATQVTIFNGISTVSGAGTVNFASGSNTNFNGTTSFNTQVSVNDSITGTTNSSAIFNNSATWNNSAQLQGTSSSLIFNGSLSATSDVINELGTDNSIITNGATTIAAGHSIIVASSDTFTNNGTLTLANNGSFISGSTNSASAGTFTNTGTLLVNNNSTHAGDLGVAITNTGAVDIQSGSLALTNGATYTQTSGSTALESSGTASQLGSDHSSSTFSGGTLSGNGFLAGSSTFSSGSTILPGTAGTIGRLYFGDPANTSTVSNSVTWNGGAYNIDLLNAFGNNTAGTDNDTLNISGSLQLAGLGVSGFNLNVFGIFNNGTYTNAINSFSDTGHYDWTIASTTGGIFGFNAANFVLNLSGLGYTTYSGTWSVLESGDGKNLLLQYANTNSPVSPVPEPSTYAAIGLLACGGLASWRMRQRRNAAAATAKETTSS